MLLLGFIHVVYHFLRPDEVASVWRLQKLVCYKFDNFALFQHLGRYFNMDTHKVSNPFWYLPMHAIWDDLSGHSDDIQVYILHIYTLGYFILYILLGLSYVIRKDLL